MAFNNSRRCTSPIRYVSRAREKLAVLSVVIGILLACTCHAFALGTTQKSSSMKLSTRIRHSQNIEPFAISKQEIPHGTSGAWGREKSAVQIAVCAVTLLSMTCHWLSSKQRSQSTLRRSARVVLCAKMDASCAGPWAAVSHRTASENKISTEPSAQQSPNPPSYVCMPSVPNLNSHCQLWADAPFVGHVSCKLQDDCQHASSRPVKKLGVGLRVGKTRYPEGKRRHQARTRAASHAGSGSAHRRCTGARLQQKRYAEPRILSFDPSRLEMKRQVVLRTSSSAHTHNARESSTPCTSKGLTASSCAFSFSSNFQAIMDDKYKTIGLIDS